MPLGHYGALYLDRLVETDNTAVAEGIPEVIRHGSSTIFEMVLSFQ